MEFFSFDESYLQRLRGGDFPTEQHFVDYFGQLLLIKLRSRLRSSQSVDDIRQETFVRVLKAVRTGGVRSAEGLGSFVNSICNNVLQEYYRSSARSVSSQDENPFDPPDTSIDLDGMLVAKQTREQVRHALSMLSKKDRRLLRALLFEEKNKDEICTDFGVDRDICGYFCAVRSRVFGRFTSRRSMASKPVPDNRKTCETIYPPPTLYGVCK